MYNKYTPLEEGVKLEISKKELFIVNGDVDRCVSSSSRTVGSIELNWNSVKHVFRLSCDNVLATVICGLRCHYQFPNSQNLVWENEKINILEKIMDQENTIVHLWVGDNVSIIDYRGKIYSSGYRYIMDSNVLSEYL